MKARKTAKGNIKITLTDAEAYSLQRLICNSEKAMRRWVERSDADEDDYLDSDEDLIGLPLWHALDSVGIHL